MPYSKGVPAVAGVASIVQRGTRTFLEIWPGFRILSATAAPLSVFLMRGDMLTGSYFRVSPCDAALLVAATAFAAPTCPNRLDSQLTSLNRVCP